MIHQTAIIDSNAKIGNNVDIGPYCVIGSEVQISDNNKLYSHVNISGNTKIGEGNTFYPFCSIGNNPQDLKYNGEKTELVIGNNNKIREYVTIHPGTIGGGIRMNSGCYGTEFKDVLESVQVIDFDGKIYSIKADKIKFSYRQTNLPKNLIFLSASFKCNKKNKCEILNKINELKN